MTLDANASHATDDAPAFVITTKITRISFYLDPVTLDDWIAVEGDELKRMLPSPGTKASGQDLSELAQCALSATVLVCDHPGVELNVHGCDAGEPGYIVRLNNLAGCQTRVGLTSGFHELRWPPHDLTIGAKVRYHLQQICDAANSLLNDMMIKSPF